MRYRGLVFTGTRGSGKSTLAEVLCKGSDGFEHVPAVTTRKPRKADVPGHYTSVGRAEFEALRVGKRLLVESEYGGEQYGIVLGAVETVEKRGGVPVLTVAPDAAGTLGPDGEQGIGGAWGDGSFMTVFLDGEDDELDRRLNLRGGSRKGAAAQRKTDRDGERRCIYSIVNGSVEASVAIVQTLWETAGRGGVIPRRILLQMLRCGMVLTGWHEENVSGASYDLSLGDEYYKAGKIHRLGDREPILLIEPYDFAIVTSHECAAFPRDVCGRFDLRVSLFAQGIILSNGPQIDPGFRGPLFCLLFNVSSAPVMLKRRQHYATLELHKLIEPTCEYGGQYLGKRLIEYLPSNAARGAINELKRELEETRSEALRLHSVLWAVLSLIMALFALLA